MGKMGLGYRGWHPMVLAIPSGFGCGYCVCIHRDGVVTGAYHYVVRGEGIGVTGYQVFYPFPFPFPSLL